MKKIFCIFIFFTSCIQNRGGTYDSFVLPYQTVTFDFSQTADFNYSSTDMVLNSSGAKLTPRFEQIDDFSDDNDADWVSFVTGVSTITHTENTNRLNFDCTNSWAGVYYLPSDNYTDYMIYNEVTVSNWDLGAQPIGILGRYVDANNFYMAQTFGGTHYLYKRLAGLWTPLASGPGFTPTTGVTYGMKLRATGSNNVTIEYKVWDISGAEPASWSLTASESNPPSTTITSGMFAMTCFAGDGYWTNAKVYDGTFTTDYDTSVTKVEFPLVTGLEPIESFQAVNFNLTENGGDEIRFEASADNGATYLTYDGTAWVVNATGYADAIDLATLQAAITEFPVATSSIQIRAYLKSFDGSTTPSINSATLTYKVQK
ncbi:MAG: hypothetical protein JNM93_00940 [Bacteriovoracaceae bacterium]|nr:hypothetical protein [Bacteriovoracaceae bacterium]